MTVANFDDSDDAPQAAPLGVGLHRGISPARYHADPCETPSLSSSIASLLLDRSPAHARLAHPRFGNSRLETDEETPAMARGTLLHRLLLGRGAEIEAVEPKTKGGEASFSWSTADAKEARKRILSEGRIPVLAHKLREAELAAEVIRANLGEFEIDLAPGNSEIVAVWKERSGALCRGLLDNFDESIATIYDPKFTDDASPAACTKKIGPMGYAVQAAAYLSGVGRILPELAGRLRFVFLFCEPTAPYSVTPVELSGEFLEYGERRWRRAVSLWEECLRDGDWPHYVDYPITVEPPPWLLQETL